MGIRVLLCDDQALVREGFRTILEAEGIVIAGEADDVAGMLATCQRVSPDVVVTETRLKGVPVVDTVRALCTADPPQAEVVVLSSEDDDSTVAALLRAGVVGYALKSQSGRELADGIRQVAAGQGLLAPSVTKRFVRHFATLVPAEDVHTPYGTLSQREIDVLRLLAEGMSNAEIAAALGVGDATVKSHVSRLLTKLQLRDRMQAAAYAYRSGIVRLTPSGT